MNEVGPTQAEVSSPKSTLIPVRELLRLAVAASLLVGGLVVLAFFFQGKSGVEKTLTRLLLPYGFLWMLLSAWILQLGFTGRFRACIGPLVFWTIMTVCGSRLVANALTRYLESPFLQQNWSNIEKVDALVVLGGGTNAGTYRAQAGTSGDRIVLAAQLYYADKTDLLVTTGEALPDLRGNQGQGGAEQTVEIWTGLGIPREDIILLPGANTYQEIEALAQQVEGQLKGKRLGLLTSATHLPRGLRLCAERGIKVQPIAADFRTEPEMDNFADFIPGSAALDQFSRCQKELLARLVNR